MKIRPKAKIHIFGYCYLFFYFILFVTFFQSFYLFFNTQKVVTHYKEENEKKS